MKNELLNAAAAELDRSGFLPLPGESAEDFLKRFELSENTFSEFADEMERCGSARVFDEFELSASDGIPSEIMLEAADKTRSLYGFENRRVPGFFLSGKVGPLWGGCMIGDPDNGFALMLLRSSFRKKNKWYIYERSELLAHELCHAMRQSLSDIRLEEFFAYQTSSSFLRRNFGNCFIHERDAILFIVPTFILLGATCLRELGGILFPLWPFWLLAGLYPLFLLLRNFFSIRGVHKAEKKLHLFGVSTPLPIMFRSTFEELQLIGKMKKKEEFDAFLEKMSSTELRWTIIKLRFFDQKEENA